MAESTLSFAYDDLCRAVCDLLGMGEVYSEGTVSITTGTATFSDGNPGVPDWGIWLLQVGTSVYTIASRTNATTLVLDDSTVTGISASPFALFQLEFVPDWRRIQSILKNGLKRAYYPDSGHVWSFLYPEDSFTTVADQQDYDCPDDFEGIEGMLTYAAGDGGYNDVEVVNAEMIRKLRSADNTSTVSTYPQFAAFRPKKGTSGANFDNSSEGQRQEMMLWPTPDAEYTLSYKKIIRPDSLTPANKYPYGGSNFSDVVEASVLAAAERFADQELTMNYGALFKERLAAAIARDSRVNGPQILGYNGNSEMPRKIGKFEDFGLITYNGAEYDGS